MPLCRPHGPGTSPGERPRSSPRPPVGAMANRSALHDREPFRLDAVGVRSFRRDARNAPAHPGTSRQADRVVLLRHGRFVWLSAETFDASKAMAEDALLPAVRGAAPEDLIVASGTPCRHQIQDLAGPVAMHPVRVLEAALADRRVSGPASI